jgi:WD40 repeat protein
LKIDLVISIQNSQLKTVTVWDSTSKEIVDKFDFSAENESSVTDVLWISSGRFAASMSSGNIHIRRLESSESLQTFMHSVTSELLTFFLSKNEKIGLPY